MMEVFRICQKDYQNDLTGKGAYLFGGRWNSPGTYALYTSTHRSLALLELLMHVPLHIIKDNDYFLMSIQIPEITNLTKIDSFEDSAKVGDDILTQNQMLCFSVPSIVFKAERNIIINPMHKLAVDIIILGVEKVVLDNRIMT
jgi:RES domain-containing protein